MAKFIRVGNDVINLDNIIRVELDWDDKGGLVIEFNIPKTDDFNREDPDAAASRLRTRRASVISSSGKSAPQELVPHTMFFEGEEAEALTRFFSDEANVTTL